MKTKRINSWKVVLLIFITVIKTTFSKNHNNLSTRNVISSNESENQRLELERHRSKFENHRKEFERDEIDSEKRDSKIENHVIELGDHNLVERPKSDSRERDFWNMNDNSVFENNNSSNEIVSMSIENDTRKESSLEYFKPVIVKKFIKINLNSRSFPYTVALLRQTRFVCTGALISKQWVLTNADPFYSIHQYYRDFRVRLGSEDYKKGGVLIPVKSVELHPEYTGEEAGLDVALVQMAYETELSPSILPIMIQDDRMDKALPKGYIVTMWAPQNIIIDAELKKKTNEDTWVNARKLLVKRFALESNSVCKRMLSTHDIRLTESLICLKDKKNKGCMRNQGAPLVQDASLWGIMTPWTPPNCRNNVSSPVLAINVAESTILEWIQRTIGAQVEIDD